MTGEITHQANLNQLVPLLDASYKDMSSFFASIVTPAVHGYIYQVLIIYNKLHTIIIY